MAKKILAVVLAVMMAVSAMAISVAADQEIPLYQTTTSTTSDFTLELTIPIATQFGWGTQYDGFEIYLPTNLGVALKDTTLQYKVVVNGQSFKLKPVYGANKTALGNDPAINNGNGSWADGDQEPGTYKQTVYFGAFVHDYFVDAKGNDVYATVPQTQTFGSTTSIKIVLELSGGEYAYSWQIGKGFAYKNAYGNLVPYADAASFLKGVYGSSCYAQFITHEGEGDYYPVENSTTYLSYWNPTVNGANNDPTTNTTRAFASGDLSAVLDQTNNWTDLDGDYTVDIFDPNKFKPENALYWDHNLENRAKILGAECDYAELVVETDKPLNGIATYTLYARDSDNGQYNINSWWDYVAQRVYVDSVSINGETSELRFKVPIEMLYDAGGYGQYNDEFIIFETIGLANSTFMDSYFTATTTSGDAGIISWSSSKINPVTGHSWVNYNGKPVNYAAGGTAFPAKITVNGNEIDNPNYGGAVFAKRVYLNLPEEEATEPANDDEVKTPTEAADGANDPDSGDDMSAGETDDTPAEKNPETGIALAIVPMLVAAAAAVVSKKH